MMAKSKINIQSLVRQNVRTMKPYSSARDEFKGHADIFLDANENPFSTGYNRYPDPLQITLKEKISPLKESIPVSQIFLGNGSDEPIDLIIRAFCEPNRDAILITEPTYGMYAVCAEVNAIKIQSVRLTSDFDLDLNACLHAITDETKVIFLCSPNNPTGNLLNRDHIISLLESFNGIVVVDEAYIDFAQSKTFISQLENFENLIVLQTFSKAWGLAGLRLGMAFASEEIIAVLNKIKYPYNINIKTQEIAIEAVNKVDSKNEWVKEILTNRQRLIDELASLKMVRKIYPSDANFILIQVDDAPGTYKSLMTEGIIVRDRSKVVLCDNCLRITIGTKQENESLIQALRTL